MGSSNKSGRRLAAVQCHEAVTFVESAKRFQKQEAMLRRFQEDEMYKAYRAELASARERQEDEAWEAYWAQEEQKALIQRQEDEMWEAYRLEKASIKLQQEDEMWENYFSSMKMEEEAEEWILTNTFPSAPCYTQVGSARFWLTSNGNKHFYPTGHNGKTSKSRRYRPAEKKSDEGKFHGRPKGRSFRKLRVEGPPVSDLI